MPLPPIVVPATRLIEPTADELLPLIRRVPLETVVGPAYELLPESVSVPPPVFVRAPVPLPRLNP